MCVQRKLKPLWGKVWSTIRSCQFRVDSNSLVFVYSSRGKFCIKISPYTRLKSIWCRNQSHETMACVGRSLQSFRALKQRRSLNNARAYVTVSGNHYRTISSEYFLGILQDIDSDDMWFQQDGATCQSIHVTIDIPRSRFYDNIKRVLFTYNLF